MVVKATFCGKIEHSPNDVEISFADGAVFKGCVYDKFMVGSMKSTVFENHAWFLLYSQHNIYHPYEHLIRQVGWEINQQLLQWMS